MAIGNPRLHIICGICGCNSEFSFVIDPLGCCDENAVEYPGVRIACGNCASLTGLEEVMKEEK